MEATRRSALILLGGASAAACASLGAARPLTLDEVVRRNTLARGGAAALDRMRTLQVDAEIGEGGNTLVGRWAASTENLVRIDIYVGGKNVYAEGVDAAGGWEWPGKGDAKPASEAGRAALLNGAENQLYGWHRFPERNHRLALMPPQVIDGIDYQVVEVRYATGQLSYFYVNPASWQAERRRDERAYHPDLDPAKQKIESRFFDFTSVHGVVASNRSLDVDLATGKTLATNRTLARRINPELPPDYFDRNRRAPTTWT